jgi:hypothetical protein
LKEQGNFKRIATGEAIGTIVTPDRR